jgi:hypothetical protein
MFRPLHWANITSQNVPCRRLHCVVSYKTRFETWWWPSARVETCCLINKILHLFISCVFYSTTYTILRSKSQNPLRPQQLWRQQPNHRRRPLCTDTLSRQWRQLRPSVGCIKKKIGFRTAFSHIMSQTRTVLPNTGVGADPRVTLMRQDYTASNP